MCLVTSVEGVIVLDDIQNLGRNKPEMRLDELLRNIHPIRTSLLEKGLASQSFGDDTDESPHLFSADAFLTTTRIENFSSCEQLRLVGRFIELLFWLGLPCWMRIRPHTAHGCSLPLELSVAVNLFDAFSAVRS